MATLSKKKEKPPLEIREIYEYVEDWGRWQDYYIIKPKNVSFNQLMLTKEPVPLSLESRWLLVGFLDLTPKDIPEEKFSKLYKILKANEVTLKWIKKSIIKDQPLFVKISENSSSGISESHVVLDRRLNANPKLMNLISEVDPSALYIFLERFRLEDLSAVENESDFVKAIQKYEEKPTKILWSIALRRLAFLNPFNKNILISCIKLIDAISYELISFTEETLDSV